MDFPDEILIKKIQSKRVYFDKKSEEKTTQQINKKYKLSINSLPEIDIYIFFILTKDEHTCNKHCTIKVEKHEWENKIQPYLERCSYIDINKVESLNKEQILFKIRDIDNTFKCVAGLSSSKFKQLEKLRHNIYRGGRFISEHRKNLISKAFEKTKIEEETLKRLNLS